MQLNEWSRRYQEAMSVKEIQLRAALHGRSVGGLESVSIETACHELTSALRGVYVVTDRACEIIRSEIDRALAHALAMYPDIQTFFGRAYGTFAVDLADPYSPSLLTGLAGVGKSELRKAVGRVLRGRGEIRLDRSHGPLPLVDYREVLLQQGQRSVGQALLPLASPEVASGRLKRKEPQVIEDAANWQLKSGCCLFGVDETQFLTQSENASTLATRVLLAYYEIRVPWFTVANYSLCWRLLARPAEAVQRLLDRPVVLLPDGPDSAGWIDLLGEYEAVCAHLFAFRLSARAGDLWSLSAGLKRELVKLLVHAYRLARRREQQEVEWADVLQAYASMEFFAARRDIELLIANATQGKKLRDDLRCPFVTETASTSLAQYANHLRDARRAKVVESTLNASLTQPERLGAARLQQDLIGSKEQDKPASLKPAKTLPKKRRALPELLEAGRRAKEASLRADRKRRGG